MLKSIENRYNVKISLREAALGIGKQDLTKFAAYKDSCFFV
jgi:hypothetical protein